PRRRGSDRGGGDRQPPTNGAEGWGSRPTESQDERRRADAIVFAFSNEMWQAPPKPWLIKNVIARGETSSWIAPPGKGKSALLTDIAIHLAGGKDWRGYRTKSACGVLYLALERADLIKRRLFAHRLRDELPDLPI